MGRSKNGSVRRGWAERGTSGPGSRGGCAEFRALGLGGGSGSSGGATRREALRAGAVAAAAMGLHLDLGGLLRGRAAMASAVARGGAGSGSVSGSGVTHAARAKSCVMIFQWGGPSHLDTWDLKPEAPEDVRGEFRPIATRVPGVFISEHFPRLAERTDKLAIIRSMTHDDPAHLSPAHRLLTGNLAPVPYSDRVGPSPRDWPALGSMIGRLMPPRGVMPMSVTMPWLVSHPAAPGGRAPGQHGGWLGRAHDPFVIQGDPNSADFRVPGVDLPEGLTADRLRERRSLLAASEERGGPSADSEGGGDTPAAWDRYQERALDALDSAEARGAFRIDRESPETRDRYGRHIHGQCLLMARRLVEAGVPLVTVNWHDDGQNFWDTHGDNFNHLKNRLMPPADQGFAALLDDLSERGLLDETLVVWIGEFGRNPRITKGNAGREHWPRCYSAALAGGGIRGGTVHGASDRWAAYPTRDPVSPDDIAATIFDCLGIAPDQEIRDPLNRPLKLTPGRPLTELYA